MKGRSKEARERQAKKELLAQLRRKERFQIFYRHEQGYSDKGRWIVAFLGGWYVQDNLGPTATLGPFKTEKLARVALNRLKKTAQPD
ncbi:MAG TPA: hypothetical protein VIL85_12580 [Thermomicrobiales bacterium]|jgi:hypothetical protein